LKNFDVNLDWLDFDKSKSDVNINEKEYDENINTNYECPRCGYKW